MKRYLLFQYPDYYPGGGWQDFTGSFDSVEEARQVVLAPEYRDRPDNYEIVDTLTAKCIECNGRIPK